MIDRNPPKQWEVAATGACALVLATALVSCQSYEPRPLDPAAHREAWYGRTLEHPTLVQFLERIDAETSGAAGAFDPSDGLSLREAELVALVFNPELRLVRLEVELAGASARYAGLWPDPELFATVLHVTDSVPKPWIATPGLTFRFPVSGRIAVEKKRAEAAHRAADKSALEAEWDVWYAVGRAWVDWSAATVRVEVTEQLVAAIGALVDTTSQLVETGELPRTEAALFFIERAQRANQLRRLRGEAIAAEQRLRSLLGLSPEAPVTFVRAFDTGKDLSDATADEIAERNPTLVRLRAEYEVAERALQREVRAQYPDLTLGPLFESEAGQTRVGIFGALPIPILNANRRAIAEARVVRELSRAALETSYQLLVGRQAAARARADALEQQRTDMEGALVPLVDRQLADALRLTRLGEGSSLVLLASLTRAQDTKLDLVDVRAAEALAWKEVEYLMGPPASWTAIDVRSNTAQEETP